MTLQKLSSFQNQNQMGTLYLVPTPIGNLQDMTSRAVATLQDVDLIAAEDTRNTQRLLNHFEIKTPQISFHEHNTQMRIPELVDKLISGMNIAQVSDAGMPSISDPGHELVNACIEQNIVVVALPGANAALTALIASGLVPQPFTFYGFLPRKKKELETELETLKNHPFTLIFYEAPHRLSKTLQGLVNVFGEQRQVTLARELTKKFEEYLRGSLAEALAWSQEDNVRGEFVIIVEGNNNPQQDTDASSSTLSIEQQVEQLITEENLKATVAIKKVAKNNGLKKQEVYNIYHHLS